MTMMRTLETAVSATPVAVALEAATLPGGEWGERLGTVGLLVAAAVLAVRWLAGQLETREKEMRLERATHAAAVDALSSKHEAALAASMTLVVQQLRESNEAKHQVAGALDRLTNALERR